MKGKLSNKINSDAMAKWRAN